MNLCILDRPSKFLVFVSTTALALSATAAQAQTTNSLANGGFEDTTPQFPLPPGYSSPANHWISTTTNGGAVAVSTQGGVYKDPYTGITTNGPFSGSLDMRLSVLNYATGSAILIQRTGPDGGLPALTVGDTPILSFWSSGYLSSNRDASTNTPLDVFYYRLRYQDGAGNDLYDSGQQDRLVCEIQNCNILPGIGSEWVQHSFRGEAVPAGASSAVVEFSLFGRPNSDSPQVLDQRVYLDGVALTVTAVPEPESYALMLAGLGIVGSAVRRRRVSMA
jgi:hypothetical protein